MTITGTRTRTNRNFQAIARCMIALFCLALTSVGCAFGEIRLSDPLDRQVSLEEAQDRYTVLLRWNDLTKASAFVDPKMRDDFMKMVPNFRDLRFTEYDSATADIGEDGTATVEVTYYVYSPSSPIETTITETQVWYRDSGGNNYWHVRPSFNGIDKLVTSNNAR